MIGPIIIIVCDVVTVISLFVLHRSVKAMKRNAFDFGVICGSMAKQLYPDCEPDEILANAHELRARIETRYAREKAAKKGPA